MANGWEENLEEKKEGNKEKRGRRKEGMEGKKKEEGRKRGTGREGTLWQTSDQGST